MSMTLSTVLDCASDFFHDGNRNKPLKTVTHVICRAKTGSSQVDWSVNIMAGPSYTSRAVWCSPEKLIPLSRAPWLSHFTRYEEAALESHWVWHDCQSAIEILNAQCVEFPVEKYEKLTCTSRMMSPETGRASTPRWSSQSAPPPSVHATDSDPWSRCCWTVDCTAVESWISHSRWSERTTAGALDG